MCHYKYNMDTGEVMVTEDNTHVIVWWKDQNTSGMLYAHHYSCSDPSHGPWSGCGDQQ